MFALRQLQKASSVSRQSRPFTSSAAARRPCLSVVANNGKLIDGNNTAAVTAVHPRTFATFSTSSPSIPRTYPQYNVHGVTCMLAIKTIAPSFRLVRGESLILDQNKRGRLLLEFTPRGSEGYIWQEQIRFGLSPEEVGLICSQLPEASVELSRMPSTYERPNDDGSDIYGGQTTSDLPDKVLRVEPGEAATVKFTIDYFKDGIGGQAPGPGQEGNGGPLDIVVQAGEFKVMSRLMEESIPYLVGWTNLVELSMQRSIDDAMKYGGDASSGGRMPF